MLNDKKEARFGDRVVDNNNCSYSHGRKKRRRIRYVNWAIELYGCPDEKMEEELLWDLHASKNSSEVDETIDCEVRKAVERLSREERQFVELFYFEFKTYQEITQISKKKVFKLERIHHRAMGKLRILLAEFVKNRFQLDVPQKTDCLICSSPFRKELEELIRDKKQEETYRPLMDLFRKKYGLNIKTPQAIIGHQRKHMV